MAMTNEGWPLNVAQRVFISCGFRCSCCVNYFELVVQCGTKNSITNMLIVLYRLPVAVCA